MKTFLRYLKISGIFIGAIIVISLLLGILNLIGISYKITSILSVIIMVLMFLIIGILEGLNALKKGFLAGLKISLLLITLLILLNLTLFQSHFNLSRFIYYVLLIFSSVFGAMIGINRKKKD